MRTTALLLAACLALGLAQSGDAKCAKCQQDAPKCVSLTQPMTWAVEAATTQADCAALNSSTTATQWIMEHPQMPYPDHHPTSKTHWMKRMSDTKSTDEDNHDRLYFGGAPAVRDIKMLYEWGVDAVLNVAPNTNAAKVMGVQPLPTGAEEAKIAAEAGILYYAIDAGADLDSPDTSAKVAAFLDFALKETGYLSKAAAGKFVNGPVYTHCNSGFKSAGVLQIYRAGKKTIPALAGAAMPITTQAVNDVLNHGITLTDATIKAVQVAAGETGDIATLPKLDAAAKKSAEQGLKNYHWLKYMYNVGPVGVFDAGQIQKYHLKALKDAGVAVIINMRTGGKTAGEREPVNLLNLAGGGKTKGVLEPPSTQAEYNKTSGPGMIIGDRPPSWVCSYPLTISWDKYTDCAPNTEFNFEATNSLEWGDKIGLDTEAEGVDVEAAGMKYYHLPVGLNSLPEGIPFDINTFNKYGPQFIEAYQEAKKMGGSVLFHCTIGYRTGAFPTALLGLFTAGTGATYNAQTRVIVPGQASDGVQYTQELYDIMHQHGYDTKDAQTGHRFEVGTDALFGGLHNLTFNGNIDWSTGAITDASISMKKTPAKAPATTASDDGKAPVTTASDTGNSSTAAPGDASAAAKAVADAAADAAAKAYTAAGCDTDAAKDGCAELKTAKDAADAKVADLAKGTTAATTKPAVTTATIDQGSSASVLATSIAAVLMGAIAAMLF